MLYIALDKKEYPHKVFLISPQKHLLLVLTEALLMSTNYYENTPIQIHRKFYHQKMAIFQIKNSNIFHISAQNIDCGYSLELPHRGSSNEYPQSMFLSRNNKIMYTPVNPSFTT